MKVSARIIHSGIIFCFFLSGFSALIYEVLWVRLLSLVFGSTTLATSVVLAAFMAGLALGGFFGGRWADKIQPFRLLLVYGCLEFAIALTGVLSKPGIGLVHELVPKIGLEEIPLLSQHLIWFAVSFLLLILPSAFMGATLPILVRWSSNYEKLLPETSVGFLYGTNTLGAVLGVGTAGFFLIPAWGMNWSFLAAGSLNVIAGLISLGALFYVQENNRTRAPEETGQKELLPQKREPIYKNKFVLVLFLTGMAAMICEVAWTRAFALVLGSSTFAFTIMLLTFLLGLSLGCLSFNKVRRIFPPTSMYLGFLLFIIAFGILAYLPLFNFLPYWAIQSYPYTSQSTSILHGFQFLFCATVMIVPTMLMGLIFPWIIALENEDKNHVGQTVGNNFAANTIGGIVGSAGAGLYLLPLWGAEQSLIGAVWIYFAAAILVVLFSKDMSRRKKSLFVALSFSILLLGIQVRSPWNPYVLSSGAFLYTAEYRDVKSFSGFIDDLRQNKIIYHRDGISSTVTVLDSQWAGRFLRVNGKTDASSGKDMVTQLFLGYLPLLLHPGNPETALVVGLGSGVTSGALGTDQNLKKIDCVEIEPMVGKTVGFFSNINRRISEDKRFRLLYTDARHFFAASDSTYDIITSEPSNPWIAGIANLYTKEAFELAKKRLSDDGIFVQWFHSYSMAASDFKMVLHTFSSVFPDVMLLTTGDKDYFLVGSKKKIKIDYNRVKERISENRELRDDLTMLRLNHPFVLIATTLLLGNDDFRFYGQGAPLHSDDHPTLEFSAPRYLHKSEDHIIKADLLSAKKEIIPSELIGIEASPQKMSILYNLAGEIFMKSNQLDRAEKMLEKAKTVNGKNARMWTNFGRLHGARNELSRAKDSYRQALSLDANYPQAWFHLGMLYLHQGLKEKGLQSLEEGLKLSPSDPMGCLQVGRLYLKDNRKEEARRTVIRALEKPIVDSGIFSQLMLLMKEINS